VTRGALAVVTASALSWFGSSPAAAEPRAACTGKHRHCHAWIQYDADGKWHNGRVRPDVLPSGFGPTQLWAAYAIDPTVTPNATIAVIDAFGYPTLESDLAGYRSTFGLPPCTVASGCLTIINQTGQTSPLPAASSTQNGQSWQAEAALDLDMASSACPNCKLIAVEANDDGDDGLDVSNDAAATAGANVISNSWGAPEADFSPISSVDQHYDHPGVAIFASTGDNGHAADGDGYPSTSNHVIAVAGTSLIFDAASPRGFAEQAWSGAGSVCSKSFGQPSWQSSSPCHMRATGDLSAVADPGTGVAVFIQNTWTIIGGTSAASPLVAGIFAATGHANASSQYPYANASFFNDITVGANGTCNNALCQAGPGWDGPTGIGTPIGALMTGNQLPVLAASPPNHANVPPGFEVVASCVPKDSATVTEVDIGIDGVQFAALHTPPFVKKMPPSFANGPHTVFVHCRLSSLVVTGLTMNVEQVAPCGVDTDCNSGDLCFLGACIPGPAIPDGLGTACSVDTQCTSAICTGAGATEQCETPCDTNMACPTGFSCDPTSLMCAAPTATHHDSGCAAGGDTPVAPLVLVIGVAAFVVSSRRRRA
jgi:uncharacterized protein (TIGR03382 family)